MRDNEGAFSAYPNYLVEAERTEAAANLAEETTTHWREIPVV